MWRMDTLRWGTGLLLAEVGQTPQEKLRAPHSPWRRSALPCAHTAARSHSTETTDHFPPKQPVTLVRVDRSLSPTYTVRRGQRSVHPVGDDSGYRCFASEIAVRRSLDCAGFNRPSGVAPDPLQRRNCQGRVLSAVKREHRATDLRDGGGGRFNTKDVDGGRRTVQVRLGAGSRVTVRVEWKQFGSSPLSNKLTSLLQQIGFAKAGQVDGPGRRKHQAAHAMVLAVCLIVDDLHPAVTVADQDHALNAEAHREGDPCANVVRSVFEPLPQRAAEHLVATSQRPSTPQKVGSEVVAAVVANHEDVPGPGQLASDLDGSRGVEARGRAMYPNCGNRTGSTPQGTDH